MPKINARRLTFDTTYQRPISGDKVNEIVKNFDPDAVGQVCVSRREDGTFAVIDGQHRVAALRRLFGPEVMIDCEVLDLKTRQKEAKVFYLRNFKRRGMNATLKVSAGAAAGFVADKDLLDTAQTVGFRVVSKKENWNDIAAAWALKYAQKHGGTAALTDTLLFIQTAWNGDKKATDGHIILGVFEFIRQHSNRKNWRMSKVAGRLQKFSPDEVIRTAKKIGGSGRLSGLDVCGALRQLHDAGLRSGKLS